MGKRFSLPNFFLERDQLLIQDSNLYSEVGTRKIEEKKYEDDKRREEYKENSYVKTIFSLIFNFFFFFFGKEKSSAKLFLISTSIIKSLNALSVIMSIYALKKLTLS